MSSIPTAKMKHAHVHHDAPAADPAAPAKNVPGHQAEPALDTAKPETLTERARELAGEAAESVRERPRTVAAIGAAVLAGAAALVGGPAIARAFRGAPTKAPAKKPAARKPAARKPKAKG